jgi:hypothetical protein
VARPNAKLISEMTIEIGGNQTAVKPASTRAVKDAVSNIMVPNPFRLLSECGAANNASDDPTLGVL